MASLWRYLRGSIVNAEGMNTDIFSMSLTATAPHWTVLRGLELEARSVRVHTNTF